jgi:hypothetical protein
LIDQNFSTPVRHPDRRESFHSQCKGVNETVGAASPLQLQAG